MPAWPLASSVKELSRQTNGADCGVYAIAFTRVLINNYKKGEKDGSITMSISQEDFIFPIAEERQKLKAVGFPKKNDGGGNYDIGDDIDYYESEEDKILEWWDKDQKTLPQKYAQQFWTSYALLTQQTIVNASDFKDFSKKVRLLSGKLNLKNSNKEQLKKIYQLKRILKACSYPVYPTGEPTDPIPQNQNEIFSYIKEAMSKEKIEEINQLYTTHFPKN